MRDRPRGLRPSVDDSNRDQGRLDWQRERLSTAAQALLARDCECFFSQALSTPCLNAVRDVRGSRIEDFDGRELLDFHGNSVHNIGYAHPRLIAALKEALDGLVFSPRRYANEKAVELAEALCAMAPMGPAKCLFAPSGNDAVEIALQIARGVTGRHKMIGFWGAYHGAGVAAASVGGEGPFRGSTAGPLIAGVSHVMPPTCYRCPHGHTPIEERCCGVSAAHIAHVISEEGDVAAVIAAPLNGATYIPQPGFWQEVRRACDEHGTLLIFDEVQTGLGRTGHLFASEHYGVTPDITVLGKALGGGVVPLAAVLARAEFDRMGNAAIGHYTHEKNPVLAAAGLETLAIVRDEALVERAARLGAWGLTRMRGLMHRHEAIGDVRGLGLTMGIELVQDRPTKRPARGLAERVLYGALDRGLSLKISGGSVLALSPPLTISEGELDRAFQIIDETLSELSTERA